MKSILTLLLACFSVLSFVDTAEASLKPGEKVLLGELKEYDRKNKEITFYSKKHKKDLVFKWEQKKGPHIVFNEKKISHSSYFRKQDEMFHQAIRIFQPINEFDKKNVDLVGYVVRAIWAVDKEFHDERTRKEPSKR